MQPHLYVYPTLQMLSTQQTGLFCPVFLHITSYPRAPKAMSVSAFIRNPDPLIKDSVFDMFRLDGRTIIITSGTGCIVYKLGRALRRQGRM